MNYVTPDLFPASAEIFMLIMASVILVTELVVAKEQRWIIYLLTQLSLVGAFALTFFTLDGQAVLTFGSMYIDDLFGDFVKLVLYFTVFVCLIYGRRYLSVRNLDKGEFYVLTLFATLGMMVVISASNFVSLFLGLELLALSLYGLISIDRDSAKSTEAAMKYFVLSAMASGMLLYGMSMIYGATGTLDLLAIGPRLASGGNMTVMLFGLVFLVAGLGFKLGVVPFHMWVPDVYHGAPTAVTLFIGSATKLAAFALLMRLLVMGLFDLVAHWQFMLMILAVLSIALGNLAAIAQTNIKRMLAFSAISHMGYMLLGLASGVFRENETNLLNAYSSAMFYIFSYVLMSLAAFGMVLLLSRAGFEADRLEDYKGLNKRSPWFAAMMMIIMLSMSGLPFFIGFYAKFMVLQSVVHVGYFWLAVFAVFFSLIGAFYYLRVVKLMYFDAPNEADANVEIDAPMDMRVMLSLNALAIALLGLMPSTVLEYSIASVHALLTLQ